MIYLDNAATTFPKPPSVIQAVDKSLRMFGANPGRSGYAMGIAAAEEIYHTRVEVAEFFGAPGPECVAFTLNCTEAINFVLKGLLKPGDHVVTSNLEHNAVMRPLQALTERKITYTQAEVVLGDNDATVDNFRKALQPNTALIICMHASNVWGIRLPIERIAALAHQYEIPMCVDCAQSAGVLPISMADGFDYLCVASHKGLYAPMGTGLLLTTKGSQLKTIIEGGTGTMSASLIQPDTMPDRLESGTSNVAGISGIRAGLAFVRSKGVDRVRTYELELLRQLYRRLQSLEDIKLYTPEPQDPWFAPVLSFNIGDMESEAVGEKLAKRGIAVRSGIHCSPSAHQAMGTLNQGAVRICPSAFTHRTDIVAAGDVVEKIMKKRI